jgi:DNA repair protein RecN (Recombination protein N)
LFIEKQALAKGTLVRTNIRPLDGEGRREEVARMLAGAQITDEARAAASKLLSDVS